MTAKMLQISQLMEHPDRRLLNDEAHARPPDSLATPCALTYLVRLEARDVAIRPAIDVLADLLQRFGIKLANRQTNHYICRLGDLGLRWERHTEYSRFTFTSEKIDRPPFSRSGRNEVPDDWLQQLQNEVLVGVRVAVIAGDGKPPDVDAISDRHFNGNVLIGSRIADDNAVALTDLRIHDDGLSRILVVNDSMSEAQTGRVIQRLLEIETYRMLTLLALPVAQRLMGVLDGDERELTGIGEALVDSESPQEQQLLDSLTRLSARTQHRNVRSSYRFAAADAYYEIVLQRINELRESRITGLQTFAEFTTRRLAPAVKTYRAAAKRQQSILEQMARATKLLSTRIDIARQRQNQSLLTSMNRRVKAQLRLQATVEGLSVAAVTYYVVGLVGILAGGLVALGVGVDKSLVMGLSIPVVAAVTYLGIRRLRRRISREEAVE